MNQPNKLKTQRMTQTKKLMTQIMTQIKKVNDSTYEPT